ncbi:hypothetical protein [Streptomyces sp.]|uniref:hypothetical protein n=1 Tax=Streptomyces sp. TaxID=1931 RepID=UPI002F3FAA04
MPQHIKHAAALAAVPTALESLDVLQAAGTPQGMVDAVRLCVDYARERAEQGVAKAARDASTKPNRALSVPVAFKERVYAGAEDNTHVATVVENSLRDFIEGDWTPPAPRRAGRGQKPASTNINVRVAEDLWDAANAHGKDPAQIAARGYKLTAVQVAIAALAETFGQPDTEDNKHHTTA